MNALKGSITCAAKLLSPKFYAEKYCVILSNTRKSLHAGSPAPLFKAMLLVGVVGYTMEYSMVGRHHVADRQKIIQEAMAKHHH
mmetsp:Transcript_3692/g.7371  ORF Transcript_3692/g.7371 Transcript_3692/m.7371 type:complete len:84 (+) Transcript_3692:33-284(+)